VDLREGIKLELLQMARELQPEQMPRFFGDMEEIVRTAELHAADNARVRSAEELLDIKQASELTKLSTDTLYRKTYVFTRRIGRRRLFSRTAIELAILNDDLQPLQTHGNVTYSNKIRTKPKRAF
jgi:hypothetical protein